MHWDHESWVLKWKHAVGNFFHLKQFMNQSRPTVVSTPQRKMWRFCSFFTSTLRPARWGQRLSEYSVCDWIGGFTHLTVALVIYAVREQNLLLGCMCAHVAQHYQTQCCPNKSFDVSFSTLLKAVARGVCMPPGSSAPSAFLSFVKKKKNLLKKKKKHF